MIRDLDIARDIAPLFEKKVILYGASGLGKSKLIEYKKCGINVVGFSDGDVNKWGDTCNGYPIYSHDELKEMDERDEIVIIITSCYSSEIEIQLENKGIAIDRTYSTFGVRMGIYNNRNCGLINSTFSKDYNQRVNDWNRVNCLMGTAFTDDVIDSINWRALRDIVRGIGPVWNFQAGKVASQSFHYYLLERGIPSLHVHDFLCFFENQKLGKNEIDEIVNMIHNSGEIKIIAGVREPISRDIALSIQAATDDVWSGEDLESFHLMDLCKRFLKLCIGKKDGNFKPNKYNWLHYLADHAKYGAEFDWFKWELQKIVGIDILEYPFDCDKGYLVIKKDNVKLFLFRMEDICKLNEPLGEFLGLKDFALPHYNNAREKEYRFAYRQLFDEISFSQEYVDVYYKNNPYMDYFYSKEQQQKMLSRWINHIE